MAQVGIDRDRYSWDTSGYQPDAQSGAIHRLRLVLLERRGQSLTCDWLHQVMHVARVGLGYQVVS